MGVEIGPHLNHTVLGGNARQAHLTFCPVAGVVIQPGQARKGQLGMLTLRRAETDGAVAQVKVVKLPQEKFVDLRRTEAVFLFIVVE